MTAIEWTDATWNPVTGCSKVSPGCDHCYAETLSLRYGWSTKPWAHENAAENVVLHPDRLDQPLRWRKPRMVFVNSMSDLFHERVPVSFIAEVFDRMACATLECSHRRWDQHEEECWTGDPHIFQILTKRPERALEVLRDELPWHAGEYMRGDRALPTSMEVGAWPLPNVWIGTSIESWRFNWRANWLRKVPAAVRFISAEPVLDTLVPSGLQGSSRDLDLTGIDWLIVGGESGHGARPMRVEWARELRDLACDDAYETAFFFKQWGGRTPKAGGRVLDGRTWDEYPSTSGRSRSSCADSPSPSRPSPRS